MEKKKVLVVATVVKAHIMVFHIPILKWFKDNGYETYVCARNDFKSKQDCDIPYCDYYYNLPFERSPLKLNNLITYKKLKKLIELNEFDIIHCHTPVGGAISRLASKNAKSNKTKLIYTAHGFHFYKGAPIINWLLYYPTERWLSKYTDVLLTINKEDFDRAQNFEANSIKYIPGVGIDTKKFDALNINQQRKRSEFDIPESNTVILSVGELNKNKNHEAIIKALAKMNNPEIFYVICGEGPLKKHLEKVSEELNVCDQVKFLGFRKDIAEIIKMSDIFAFPSLREGLSLSLMEVMSSGLPVVCSDIRGNRDLIQQELGGYLVQPNDIEGFSNAIMKIQNDISLIKRMGDYNKKFVKDYDINNVLQHLEEIYAGV
ncbi:glycosyltransferase family 4 protein [Halobacillus kuroshimensis]|uniref:Glycosyltransferase family 4 protein n=1 Tax=Halobacillus kuroshimensis TaxID=302481 RepID=A0ABS3DUZ3_9BACI|nr:glycosyltransferase family 4 protein [Halobacillus kuroshimensis]MBN8235136.1 glycosyltransferase family 4 protein [Halobacillus kuroshimensis]